MSYIGPLTSILQSQMSDGVAPSGLTQIAPGQLPELGGTMSAAAPPAATSFGSILDRVVGEVNTKMEAGDADQAKLLSGESTNLHQAMISIQEASVAFSLMVEVRNKMVDSYQELMRMQM